MYSDLYPMCPWRRKLDYAKILQPKYFTDENIPIYGMMFQVHYSSRDVLD